MKGNLSGYILLLGCIVLNIYVIGCANKINVSVVEESPAIESSVAVEPIPEPVIEPPVEISDGFFDDPIEEIVEPIKQDIYIVGTWEEDRDCLWNIAGRAEIYGNPWKWRVIYEANSQNIKDPDLIYPGQSLFIPRN